MPAHRPTAQDVARLAQASRSAVSMVMNGNAAGNVSFKTQQRILAAAAELDYRPNPLGVSLRSQRTGMIGLVTDEIASAPFAGRIISGAGAVARDRGYLTVIADAGASRGARDGGELEVELIDQLLRRRVDAVILATSGLCTIQAPQILRSLPAALANCRDAENDVAAFTADEAQGGYAATAHLISLGHKDIVFLGGADDTDAAPERISGYRRALSEAGLGTGRIARCGWDIDHGFAAAQRVLDAPDRPTAIFAANDRIATGVLLAAGTLCLRVPHDLSIVGFDDQDHLAGAMVPGLTTMALPHRQMGERAAARVIDALEGLAPESASERIACTLVVRGSTAAP